MEKIYTAITGVASYLPEDKLTNEDLTKMVDTSDEWIYTRVGIKERRILKGETRGSSYMGAKALDALLEKTGTTTDEVEVIICTTSAPDYRFPATAAVIADRCGVKNCFAYDIQAACTGFLVALQVGKAYINSGLYKKVVIVSAEKMTSLVNYKDRTTCTLFGDAAAAVLLEPTYEPVGVIDTLLHTDGDGIPYLMMKGGGSAQPITHEGLERNEQFLYQEGRTVYKYAVSNMIDVYRQIMIRNQLSNETVSWFIPHQANARIIEAVGSRLGISHDKVIMNIEHLGNTGSATIPVCLAQFEKQFRKGDNLLFTAFGAGFTWGSTYVKWAYDTK